VQEERGLVVKVLGRSAAVAVSVLVLGALGAGVAWAAPAQQPLVGKVTRVSVSGRFFVVNGKVVYVRRTTVIHLVRGRGLRGLRTGRRVRVTVVERNGKLYAVDVRLVRVARRGVLPVTT
jgi:cold shock CspA family protein